MERHLVAAGENSYWAIGVDYLELSAGGKATSTKNQRARVDYKELLSPEEFTQFAELRNLRKELAQEDGVPIYAVLTNEQLAQIVQQRVGSKTDLGKVAGIGEGNRRPVRGSKAT
jgi:superfamily II DNA helicase RecQ